MESINISEVPNLEVYIYIYIYIYVKKKTQRTTFNNRIRPAAHVRKHLIMARQF